MLIDQAAEPTQTWPIETGTQAGIAGVRPGGPRPTRGAPPALDGELSGRRSTRSWRAPATTRTPCSAPTPAGRCDRRARCGRWRRRVTVVLPDGRRFPASHLHEGVFAATLPVTEVPDYRIAVAYPRSPRPGPREAVTDDPYRYLPTLGEVDLYLIGE